MDIIKNSLLISVCLGSLWLIMVQACSVWTMWAGVYGSLLALLCCVLLIFLDQSQYAMTHLRSWREQLDFKYYTLIGLVLLCVFLVIISCVYRRNMTLTGIFLSQTARFLADSTPLFLLVFAYLVVTAGYLLLNVLIHWALSTTNSPKQTLSSDIWLRYHGSKLLQAIHIIVFLWGLQFIRDSCNAFAHTVNYLISGNAVEWYFTHRSTRCFIVFRRMFRRNFGSVVAGSFHNIFFGPLAVLADCITVQSYLSLVLTRRVLRKMRKLLEHNAMLLRQPSRIIKDRCLCIHKPGRNTLLQCYSQLLVYLRLVKNYYWASISTSLLPDILQRALSSINHATLLSDNEAQDG